MEKKDVTPSQISYFNKLSFIPYDNIDQNEIDHLNLRNQKSNESIDYYLDGVGSIAKKDFLNLNDSSRKISDFRIQLELGKIEENDPINSIEEPNAKNKIEEDKKEKNKDIQVEVEKNESIIMNNINLKSNILTLDKFLPPTPNKKSFPDPFKFDQIKDFKEKWKRYIEDVNISIDQNFDETIKEKLLFEELKQNSLLRSLVDKSHDKIARKTSSFNYQTININFNEILLAIILRDFTIHRFVISDYELRLFSKYATLDYKICENNSHIFYGIILILFIKGLYEKAIQFCDKILGKENEDQKLEILVWKGILYFYLYMTTSLEEIKLKSIENAQSVFIQILKKQKDHLLSLYCLLIISRELKVNINKHKTKILNKPEKYATEIFSQNKIIGYIAWTDIYLNSGDKSKIQCCPTLLKQIIDLDPTRIEGYLKLFYIYYRNHKYDKSLQILAEASTQVANINNPFIFYLLTKYICKTLVKMNRVYSALDLLQLLYIDNPYMFTLLFYYAKIVYKTNEKYCFSNAISALEECLISCNSDLHSEIKYLLGCLYLKKNEIIDAMISFEDAKINLPKPKILKFIELNEAKYLCGYQSFKKMINEISKYEYYSSKIEFQFPPLEELKTAQKSLLLIDPFCSSLLEALISFYILNNKNEGIIKLEKIIENYPNNPRGPINLWKMYFQTNNLEGMLKVASKMVESFRLDKISGSQWIYCHILYAKTLEYKFNFNKAISVLQSLVTLIPQISKNSLSLQHYDSNSLSKSIVESNKDLLISSNFDIDKPLSMSKQMPHEKSTPDFNNFNNVTDLLQNSPNINLSNQSSVVNYVSILKNAMKSINNGERSVHFLMSVNSDSQRIINDISRFNKLIFCFENKFKLEEINSIDANSSPFFLVTTNAKFLYILGKMSVKSNTNLRLGVQALSDYLTVFNHFGKQRDDFENFENGISKRELKAKFWIGIALYYAGNFKEVNNLFNDLIIQLKEQKLKKLESKVSFFLKEKIMENLKKSNSKNSKN